MSWRFRKSFKVLPGLRLNLTQAGLSATIGASPFSVNVGPKGVYGNVGIPGTGIWDRVRLDGDSQPPPLALPITLPSAGIPSGELRSASTEALESVSLDYIRNLLRDAHTEREAIGSEITNASASHWLAKDRYNSWNNGLLLKRVFKENFQKRQGKLEEASAHLEELQEQLRQTTLATTISIEKEQSEPYFRLLDTFAALSGEAATWNLTSTFSVDQFRERSTAIEKVDRRSVSFSLGTCDLIAWDRPIPHLPNLTGGEMYLFPGFILYRESKAAFALIESQTVRIEYAPVSFHETNSIPSDSHVIGHTWVKANKDGSPDRRFANNHQIPIVQYGGLHFSSPNGLNVRYQCSNVALAQRFATAWLEFRMSMSGAVPQSTLECLKVIQLTHHDFITRLLEGSSGTGKGTMSSDDFSDFISSIRKTLATIKELPDGAKYSKIVDAATRALSDFEQVVVSKSKLDDRIFQKLNGAIATFFEKMAEASNKSR